VTKYLSIDPGKFKCGFVFADIKTREVKEAIVLRRNLLIKNIDKIRTKEKNLKLLIGNGTSSNQLVEELKFIRNDLVIVDETNTTYRAKERYFEIFPKKGLKRLIPNEILINNINLDAIAALIILEDYVKFKFELNHSIKSKTWKK
tara:strand:- start:53 stop:490 length:438 start_codon:yes stop_codon:yes gene_type:complete